uniref:Uncharacterized protein n=1 Tax=Myripristis murdjan TaxID=586833 RepID=A0A667ZSQ9_9TELE
MNVWIRTSFRLPPQHGGWLWLWEEGNGCSECSQVKDTCGCCEQWANVEGQQCDPDGAQKFYGRCGEGLVCQRKMTRGLIRSLHELGEDPATLVTALIFYSTPRVVRAPRDQFNHTGNDAVFGYKVSACPLLNLSWRKRGSDHVLSGDDPHMSVQARGGPQCYTVSTWQQIQGLHLSDAGVDHCIFHNALVETFAAVQLTVLRESKCLTMIDSIKELKFNEEGPSGGGRGAPLRGGLW